MKSSIKALLLCVVLGLATMAQAVEVAGMKIDDTVQASNTTLFRDTQQLFFQGSVHRIIAYPNF